MRSLVSRYLTAWRAWRLQRKVERRSPEIAELRKAEAKARRQHRPTRSFQKAKEAIVIANLRRELGA